MALKLRKPILVGGIGISFGLWLWWDIQDSLMQVGEFGLLSVMALGSGLWLLKRNSSSQSSLSSAPSPVSEQMLEEAIAQAKTLLAQAETEASDRDLSEWQQQIDQLPERLQRQSCKLALVGSKSTGKTSLQALLEKSNIADHLEWVETEALLSGEDSDAAAQKVALDADCVLFVTAGDLTASELQVVEQLRGANQRVVLLLNKRDRYLPEERSDILQRLRQHVVRVMSPEDVVAVAAAPLPMKVKQHQADGSVREWMEPQQPEIEEARDRLSQILQQEREQLLLATTWREAGKLKQEIKEILNAARRDRALPIVEQYQWIAAAAAFANPVSALDLLATAAISAQMLVDLGAIYQQNFSLSQAQTASGTLGKLMVKLGLVELSTQAMGSLLKSNAVTYAAGGAVQGASAAYLTRLAGLSLIEYFQDQEADLAAGNGLNLEKFGQTLQKIFEQNQRAAVLQDFAQRAWKRLSPAPETATAIASSSS